MEPGLQTPEQIEAAKKFIQENFPAALKYVREMENNTWKMPPAVNDDGTPRLGKNGEPYVYTVGDIKAEHTRQQANPFYKRIQEIFNDTKDESTRESSLDQLKEQSLEGLKSGVANKGIGTIFAESFQNLGANIAGGISFDPLSPLQSLAAIPQAITAGIWKVFGEFVKEAALAYGGDAAAPWLKAFKHNNIDPILAKFSKEPQEPFTRMTPEDAKRNLQFQNAAKGLARALGVSDPNNPNDSQVTNGFAHTVAHQLDKKLLEQQTQIARAPEDKDGNAKGTEKSPETGTGAKTDGSEKGKKTETSSPDPENGFGATGKRPNIESYEPVHVATGTPVAPNIGIGGRPNINSIT